MSEVGFDLPAYLARVGCRGLTGATLPALTALHEAHAAAVPFENLDILLGREVRLDLESLQRKLVAARRGGYCFEQNTLFQAALENLGFAVTALAARVRFGSTGVRPRLHMLLRVTLPEGAFLADVGFGGGGPVHPVPFEPGVAVRTGCFAHRLVREDDWWVLQGSSIQARTGPFADRLAPDGEGWVVQDGPAAAWTDLYAFTLEPQYPVDFEVANHYTSTWPTQAFVVNLTAQRSWPDHRIVLRNRELAVEDAGGTRVTRVDTPERLLQTLRSEFGLIFPAGTRFSARNLVF